MKFGTVEQAIADIRAGKLIVVADDEDRENEGDLICASELVTPEMINFMIRKAGGWICLALTGERVVQRRAQRKQIRARVERQVVHDLGRDEARCAHGLRTRAERNHRAGALRGHARFAGIRIGGDPRSEWSAAEYANLQASGNLSAGQQYRAGLVGLFRRFTLAGGG